MCRSTAALTKVEDKVFIMNKKRNDKRTSVFAFPRRFQRNNYDLYRLMCLVGVLLICGLLFIIGTQYFQYLRVKRELADYEMRSRELEARKAAVLDEIERLHDLNYVEILARQRIGLVKPGEIIFQFED